MRIIAGKYKSRNLFSSVPLKKNGDDPLRPTTDRARESLFNILNNIIDFEDLKCLDLFAGTGAIGFELLSRGASHVDFVENSLSQINIIEKNSEVLKCEKHVNIFKQDVHDFLFKNKNNYYDLIFADPPYDKCNLEWIKQIPGLNFTAFVLESRAGMPIELKLTGYSIIERTAGITSFKIFVSENEN